jgi:predicted lipoprotein with Yx(FWY)xxD motif
MRTRISTRRLIGRGLVSALLVAATSLGGAGLVAAQSYSSSPSPQPSATPTPPSSLQLGTATSATFGQYLTDPDGHALYTLSSDTATGSTCTGHCLTVWPPLLIAPGGSITGPTGTGGAFSTVVRTDTGATQVRYNGHPLYRFQGDTAPGQTNGEGIQALGGTWHLATLAAATTTPTASTPATTAAPSTLPATDTSGAPSGPSGSLLPLVLIGLLALAGGLVLVSPLRHRVRP